MSNQMAKQILAIDPGTVNSAYVHWDGGQILSKGKIPNEELRLILVDERRDSSMSLAIEMIASYGMAVGKEVFETCLWIGRFLEVWDQQNKDWELIYRRDVRLHHCHSPKANDSNVRMALIDRLGAPGTKKNPGATYGCSKDVWQALALAVYQYDKLANGGLQCQKSA